MIFMDKIEYHVYLKNNKTKRVDWKPVSAYSVKQAKLIAFIKYGERYDVEKVTKPSVLVSSYSRGN